ncbi:hypothetical protein KKD03_03060 [Patescibacteria group bacterium]|nr:hypothetical protein [Patescibacteria group bacterium]
MLLLLSLSMLIGSGGEGRNWEQFLGQWKVVWQPDFTVSFTDVYAIDSQKVWAVGYDGTVV